MKSSENLLTVKLLDLLWIMDLLYIFTKAAIPCQSRILKVCLTVTYILLPPINTSLHCQSSVQQPSCKRESGSMELN